MDKVSYNVGRTLNAGNYESVRLDFGIELEVKEGEKKSDAMRRAVKFVDMCLNKKVEEVVKQLDL